MRKKILTKEEALLKMASLCARSEQCESDIMRKLRTGGLGASDAAEVIAELKERRFLDAFRFARSFSHDKVRFSGWGRMKIRAALLAKGLPDKLIAEAAAEIEDADYRDALTRSARAKASALDLSTREGRSKLYRHLLSRGFESSLAADEVRKILAEKREQ